MLIELRKDKNDLMKALRRLVFHDRAACKRENVPECIELQEAASLLNYLKE